MGHVYVCTKTVEDAITKSWCKMEASDKRKMRRATLRCYTKKHEGDRKTERKRT